MDAMRAMIVLLISVALAVPALASGAPAPRVVFSVLPHGWSKQDAYALSWRYRPNAMGWAPSMPRDGIAVTVIVLGKPRVGYPPLRLRMPRRPFGMLEGAADTPEYRIVGSVLGRDVEIRVDIRRVKPTGEQLRKAQRVVSGIRFVAP